LPNLDARQIDRHIELAHRLEPTWRLQGQQQIPVPLALKHPSNSRALRLVGHNVCERGHVLVEPRDIVNVALEEVVEAVVGEGLELLALGEDPFLGGKAGVDARQQRQGRHCVR